jgi:hypothetical protein
MSAKLEALRDQVMALSLPQRLRLAAELIELHKDDIAEPIIQTALDTLKLARLFPKQRHEATTKADSAEILSDGEGR